MGFEPQFSGAGVGTRATVPPSCAGEGAQGQLCLVTKPSWAGLCCPPGLSCPGAFVQVGSGTPDGLLGAELPSREPSSSGARMGNQTTLKEGYDWVGITAQILQSSPPTPALIVKSLIAGISREMHLVSCEG